MRLTECCQLFVSDIQEIDNTPCILINDDPDGDEDEQDAKRVKTDAGKRYVPVHPELVRIGFLNFVKEKKSPGGRRLFPELKKGADGYYSGPFSKWFNDTNRFLDKAGAKAKGTSFHSFRHNYRDALREADISPQRVRALGGWARGGGAEEIYGGGLKASTLYKEIEKIEYPGLNLSHL